MRISEERVVHLGGESAPKFGWCVIMMGGPGSGKSVAVEGGSHYIAGGVKLLGNFKIYNPDKLKELFIKFKQNDAEDTIILPSKDGGWETVDLTTATVFYPPDSPDAKEVLVGEPYNTTNPRYMAFLHDRLSGLSRKWREQILAMGKNATDDRLPNILFDMTGDNFDKVQRMTIIAKEIGYKVAVVWALTSLPTAIDRDSKRIRTVGMEKVVATHEEVRSVARRLVRSTWFNDVDEMWVVVTENPSAFSDDEIDSKGYPINAYKIDSEQDIDDLIKRYITIKPYSDDYRNNEASITEGMSKSQKNSCSSDISYAMFIEHCDDMLYDIRYGDK